LYLVESEKVSYYTDVVYNTKQEALKVYLKHLSQKAKALQQEIDIIERELKCGK
jgi:hypothetical protein